MTRTKGPRLDAETEAILLEAELQLNEQYRAVGLTPHADLPSSQCQVIAEIDGPCRWHPQCKFDPRRPF
jgi:hypothetical protein